MAWGPETASPMVPGGWAPGFRRGEDRRSQNPVPRRTFPSCGTVDGKRKLLVEGSLECGASIRFRRFRRAVRTVSAVLSRKRCRGA